MKLSARQIAEIRAQIDQSEIQIQTLKDDLLDHLCCVVEVKIERGEEFDVALNEALMALAPDGLDALQDETFYLINATKMRSIKKLMFFIGLTTSISMSVGWTFTILHWPGGGTLLTYGFLGFVLLFVPMVVINHFKTNLQGSKLEKFKIVLGLASGMVIASAVLFKLFHLQGADALLLAGGMLFSFGFLPFLFYSMYRKTLAR